MTIWDSGSNHIVVSVLTHCTIRKSWKKNPKFCNLSAIESQCSINDCPHYLNIDWLMIDSWLCNQVQTLPDMHCPNWSAIITCSNDWMPMQSKDMKYHGNAHFNADILEEISLNTKIIWNKLYGESPFFSNCQVISVRHWSDCNLLCQEHTILHVVYCCNTGCSWTLINQQGC